MNKESTQYIFLFALIICVVCSVALSLVSEGLRSRKETNVAIDIKKNILKAVNLKDPLPAKVSSEDILKIYDEKIEEIVVNDNGEVHEGVAVADARDSAGLHPVFVYVEGGQKMAYAFPIIGKGLWSTLYGYLAIEPDAKTVRGITFYQHGETPGLGAEIEKDWFTSNFVGKSIWDMEAQELQPVVVVKGKVEDKISKDKRQHYVDGISGATMTSIGVTNMVNKWLHVYEPFFAKIRKP